MSTLYITEFAASGNSSSGAQLPVGSMPPVANQVVTFTTSSVQSGEKARDDEKYLNRRAEMWGEMRDWLVYGCIDDDTGLLPLLTNGQTFFAPTVTRVVTPGPAGSAGDKNTPSGMIGFWNR